MFRFTNRGELIIGLNDTPTYSRGATYYLQTPSLFVRDHFRMGTDQLTSVSMVGIGGPTTFANIMSLLPIMPSGQATLNGIVIRPLLPMSGNVTDFNLLNFSGAARPTNPAGSTATVTNYNLITIPGNVNSLSDRTIGIYSPFLTAFNGNGRRNWLIYSIADVASMTHGPLRLGNVNASSDTTIKGAGQLEVSGNVSVESTLKVTGFGPRVKAVTTNTALAITDCSVIRVSPTSSAITITLPVNASIDSFKQWTISKQTNNSYPVNIVAASGLIAGLSQYQLTRYNEFVTIAWEPGVGYYITQANPTDASTSAVTASSFGIVADLRRITTVATNGSNKIKMTCQTNDVGKVIVVNGARSNTAYHASADALTATVTAVNGTLDTATISIAATASAMSTTSYIGTNNYDAMQNAITYCNANNKNFDFDLIGTTLWCPKLSSLAAGQTYKGINITAPIKISGRHPELFKIKLSLEDDNNTNKANNYDFRMFFVNTRGTVMFENFTMLAPDRVSTEVVKNLMAVHSNPALTGYNGQIILHNTPIKGDRAAAGNPYWYLQWGRPINISPIVSGGSFHRLAIINDLGIDTIMANTEAISYFPDDTSAQLYIRNLCIYNSGSPLERLKTYTNGGSITTGSNVLTVNPSTDPDFSFYDQTSQYGNFTNYKVFLDNGVDTMTVVISSITSKNTAIVTANATKTFSNAKADFRGIQSSNPKREGHAIYAKTYIKHDIDGYYSTDVNGHELHLYNQSDAVSGGKGDSSIFKNIYSVTTSNKIGGQISEGCLFGADSIKVQRIEGGSFLYANGYSLRVKAKDVTFLGNINVNTNGSEFINCIGTGYTQAAGKATLYNCRFNSINTTGSGVIDKYEPVKTTIP